MSPLLIIVAGLSFLLGLLLGMQIGNYTAVSALKDVIEGLNKLYDKQNKN